ncbi:MAG: hypothetical protein ACE5EU_13955, partial [Paracoccaceae bacterium]
GTWTSGHSGRSGGAAPARAFLQPDTPDGLPQSPSKMAKEAIEEKIDAEPRCRLLAQPGRSQMRGFAAGVGSKTDIGVAALTQRSLIGPRPRTIANLFGPPRRLC